MDDETQSFAVTEAKEAVAKHKVEKDIANQLKKAFDKKFVDTTWHCIVGGHFSISLTHATTHCIYFKVGGRPIVLFQSE